MEGIHMTKQEQNRADLFLRISQKMISQSKAAEELGVSLRHLQRLGSFVLTKFILPNCPSEH